MTQAVTSATQAARAARAAGEPGAAGQAAERAGYVVVSVPATSANLGVGFDCLGMALDLRANFGFLRSDHLEIYGCEERFRGEDNLVWTSYLTALAAMGVDPIPVRIDIDSPVPLAGGLGSSSTCVVAGVVAAQAMAGRPYDPAFTLDVACGIEGHPDNVAPAILGGLVSSFMSDGEVFSTHTSVSPDLRFVTVAPPYEVRTADARRVMPEEVPLKTCVWQMGRCVATVQALEKGDERLLAAACRDRLHEPYRKMLIADYESLRATALDAGACAFFISGSGSTMVAVAKGAERAGAVHDAFALTRPNFWMRILSATDEGARIEHA